MLMDIIEFSTVFIYCFCLLMIFLFSLGQLHLTWHYIRNKKRTTLSPGELSTYPKVTVQLPLYNEKNVAERLINKIVQLRYPKELLQIQVLDDSTDETSLIVSKLVSKYKIEGYLIDHLVRNERVGFKAGALQNGLQKSTGEFIAIFDSDFLPPENFLLKSLPHFQDKSVGIVQSRWGHLNEDYSLLTQIQAFGLNAHFSIEQSGRKAAGSFINFNGTGGVWRKTCIEDAGGWSADTLTEDLDLSYRAQLKNWKCEYLEDLISPAELPILISAIKTQQFRWNKGAAETGRKLIKQVIGSSKRKINKLHSIMHLFNSSVFLFLFIAGVLSIPVLFFKQGNRNYEILFDAGAFFLIGFFSITFFYRVAYKNIKPSSGKSFAFLFPVFLVVIMGLSLHNSVAVLQGLFGLKSPFKRTPKFNVFRKGDEWKSKSYSEIKANKISWTEGLISLYFLAGLVAGIYLGDFKLMLFHCLLFSGFTSVFYLSIKHQFAG
jgi:cellulose synthase/poly-beta-1,6-N-acetylglucosamine synthase-like glycosyltransferase